MNVNDMLRVHVHFYEYNLDGTSSIIGEPTVYQDSNQVYIYEEIIHVITTSYRYQTDDARVYRPESIPTRQLSTDNTDVCKNDTGSRPHETADGSDGVPNHRCLQNATPKLPSVYLHRAFGGTCVRVHMHCTDFQFSPSPRHWCVCVFCSAKYSSFALVCVLNSIRSQSRI